MPQNPSRLSRRGSVSSGGTLLAGFGPGAVLPGARAAADRGAGGPGGLALFAPAAAAGEPQRITVDLRAACDVGSVRLLFEGAEDPPPPAAAGAPRATGAGAGPAATGSRGEASATRFRVEASAAGPHWRTVAEAAHDARGAVDLPLAGAAGARWIRVTLTRPAGGAPVGLGGFQVYGRCDGERPPAVGWTGGDGIGPERGSDRGPDGGPDREPDLVGDPWTYGGRQGDGRPDDGRREAYLAAVAARLGTPTSSADFARKAQFLHYETVRARFEAWNADLWQDADALLLWTSHPSWAGTVWQSYDGGLDLNGGYYGARKGCEPLHIQADPADGRVLVANHTAAPVGGVTATARLYGLGGRALAPAATRVLDVPAADTADAFAVPFAKGLPAAHLLRLRLTDAGGRVLSANDYWRYRTPMDMRSLNGLPSVRLSVAARPAGPAAVTASVRNTGAAPAAFVRLSLADPRTGERVLPVLADDDCLWLLPGEERDVTLSWASSPDVCGTPRVVAQAYNAVRVTG